MRQMFKLFFTAAMLLIGLSFTAQAQTLDPDCNTIGQIHGIFNMSCFARQSGETDDTARITRAVTAAANVYGGTILFPQNIYDVAHGFDGSYVVSGSGVSLPSGIIIQGVNSADFSVPTRLKRSGSGPIFTIGQQVKDLTIRDISLVGAGSLGSGAIGIKASGASSSTSASYHIFFSNVGFTNLDKGIMVEATDSTHNWQFDNVRLEHSLFIGCTTGIELNSYNTGWDITSCSFDPPASGIGINVIRGGYMTMNLIIGNGPYGSGTYAGTLFSIAEHGNVTITNSTSEGFLQSLEVTAANRDFPITLINNQFGDAVKFTHTATVVSTGNFYGPTNVEAYEDTQIYSFGDKFCYEGASNCATGDFQLNNNAAILFRTGQNKNTASVPTKLYNTLRVQSDDASNYPTGDPEGSGAIPLFAAIAPTNNTKPLIRLGQTLYYYDLNRDATDGFLDFNGNQTGHVGYRFKVNGGEFSVEDGNIAVSNGNVTFTGGGTVTLGSKTYSALGSPANGTLYYCSDCTQTATCSGSGSGALAKRIAGVWQCN